MEEEIKKETEKEEERGVRKLIPFSQWLWVFVPLLLAQYWFKPQIEAAIGVGWIWWITLLLTGSLVALHFAGDRIRKFFEFEFVGKLFKGLLTVAVFIGLWSLFSALAIEYLIVQKGWSGNLANVFLACIASALVWVTWKLSQGALPGKAIAMAGATLVLSFCWLAMNEVDQQNYPVEYFHYRTGEARFWIDDTDSTIYGRKLEKDGTVPEGQNTPYGRLAKNPLRLIVPEDVVEIEKKKKDPPQEDKMVPTDKWHMIWLKVPGTKGLTDERIGTDILILRSRNATVLFEKPGVGYYLGEKDAQGGYNGTWKSPEGYTGRFEDLYFVSENEARGWVFDIKGNRALLTFKRIWEKKK